MQLCAWLVNQLAVPRPHEPAAVEQRLARGLEQARTRWVGVVVELDRYLAWIAARLPDGATSLEIALDGLRLADLYLACGCASGDPKALAAFDAAFLAGDRNGSDDVKQALRQRLFMPGRDGAAPRIEGYAGRGDLKRWVRAVAARMSLHEARANPEVPTEDALLDAIGMGTGSGPDAGEIKRATKQLLQVAFREAVEALSSRERTLLLHYYIDGIGLVALGKLFGVAASSISRTLAKSRATLVSEVRRSLMRQKQIGREELDSMVDLVRSQLSLASMLRG